MYNGVLYDKLDLGYYISSQLDFFKSQELDIAEKEGEGLLGVYMQLSDESLTITRRTLSLADAFSQAGGLMSVVFVVITIAI